MKTISGKFSIILGLGLSPIAAFTIPWSTLDSGGGKSSGTAADGKILTIIGSIGQFDAQSGGASGGIFTLNGGFWAMLAPGSGSEMPRLAIAMAADGAALLSWQNEAVGWRMESSTDLSHWTNLGSVISGAGTLNVPHDIAVPKKFFRLRKP